MTDVPYPDIPCAPLDEDASWPRYACVCGHPVELHVNEQAHCYLCECEEVSVPPRE